MMQLRNEVFGELDARGERGYLHATFKELGVPTALVTLGQGRQRGGTLGGWSPPFAVKKSKNWDIFLGKIEKFH